MPPPTPVQAADLRLIADQIAYIAERYRRVADDMERLDIKTIEMQGVRTLLTANIRRLAGNAGSAERAIAEAMSGASHLKVADPPENYLETQADNAARKAAGRKKKKRR